MLPESDRMKPRSPTQGVKDLRLSNRRELLRVTGVLAGLTALPPWQPNEGHAGMAWVTLAALGQKRSAPDRAARATR